ncbi:MAG TPA: tetratricopeptide repeat protein [Phycisphaerae bacterium]|nr:tetratricopeptide repeat protein [Phycisphaerae bacterium]
MPDLTIQQAFDLALRYHQAGKLAEAEAIYRQLVAQQPDNADALHLLGAVAHQMGNNQLALELMERSIAINPSASFFHNNLGLVLKSLGHLERAQKSFCTAIDLKPDYAEAHCNLGTVFKQQERIKEAVAEYRLAIKIKPDYAPAHNHLGLAFFEKRRFDLAAGAFRTAIQHNPAYFEAFNNLGLALAAQRLFDQAVDEYLKALKLNPNDAEVRNNLGEALLQTGRFDEAVAELRASIRLKPDLAEAHNNLGNAMMAQMNMEAAINACRRAIELKPTFADAHYNLGIALANSGQLTAAIDAYRAAVRCDPDNSRLHSYLIYTLNFHPDFDDRSVQEEHKRWNARHTEELRKFIKPHANDPDPERRLRIGYVSPDFFSHAESFFITPLLETHDHQQFKIYCYSSVTRPDFITDHLRRSADVWYDVHNQSNEKLAEQIRHDQIDILIDLTMHMANNRLLLFAQKPAPVQVTWLAYPGSTGLQTIDYRFSDPYLDPPNTDLSVYSEQTMRLPESFWCYNPLFDGPPRPAQQDGPICFGSLNHPCKINDRVLDLWSEILKATPHSRLLILTFSIEHQNYIRRYLGDVGIGPERLNFVRRSPRPEYLRLYDRIDIVLDTFTCNGHTTTMDSLWMGVPVVSLAGNTIVGRGGKSILTNVGLPELVANTSEEYVDIAVKLAGDLPRLKELRTTLRQRMENSPLMDAKRFTSNVEAAYRNMWKKWCNDAASRADIR